MPAAINPLNLVLGPADLYAGIFGAAEPADSAITPNGVTTPPSNSVWTSVGGTDGGVNFEIDGTYTDLSVDQVIMNVGSRLTELKAMVTTKLSEMTLTNLNLVMNQIMSNGGGSGYATSDLQVTGAASQPTYAALLIDGWAPTLSTGAPARRRIIVRKVLSTPKATLSFDKKTQQGYDVTWNCYYISNSVLPVHIVDQQA